MAVTQISKICIKKGSINYLPDSLDEAEMCFTTDTGQIFIGAPNYPAVQYRSSSSGGSNILPYRNIRVLTEFDLVKSLTGDVYIQGPLVNFTLPTGSTSNSVYNFDSGITNIVANFNLINTTTNYSDYIGTLYITLSSSGPVLNQVGMATPNITFSATISNNIISLSALNQTSSTYKMYMNATTWST